MTMDGQKFCLKWDGFQSSVTALFDSLRQVEELVDITLCCEGHQVRAHRMMLSACSPYFRDLLKNNPCQQMVIFLKDTSATDLNAVIEFIYKGSVNVAQTQLASFIKTAETLQIRGLSGEEEKAAPAPSPRRAAPASASAAAAAAAAATPPHKRRRLSGSDYPARNSPTSPSHRPRTPTPPPASAAAAAPLAPPPPPPPPAASGLSAGLQEMPLEPVAMEQHSQHVQPPQQQQQEPVKVEKIDLTEEDDEASLDSTLCHVAEYEGAYDGSNSGLDQMPILSAAELGGLPSLSAGPSQPPPRAPPHPAAAAGGGGLPAEDGTGSDSAPASYSCDICGRIYTKRDSMIQHRKAHLGATTCQLCGKVAGRVPDLRVHLKTKHRLTLDQIYALVPMSQTRRSAP